MKLHFTNQDIEQAFGEIGEYYIVARKDRNSANWYLGGVTDETGRRVHVNLNFLPDGIYEANIFADADDAHYRDNQFAIIKQHRNVSKNESLDLYLAPGGGFAIELKRL